MKKIILSIIFSFPCIFFTINCMEESYLKKSLEETRHYFAESLNKQQKYIKAPEHLTKYQVFLALYRAAGPERRNDFLHPRYGEPFFNDSEIDVLINQGYVGTVNKKSMHINFKDFPELEVSSFEQRNGEGSALRILKSYNEESEIKEDEIRKNHHRPWGVSEEEWHEAKKFTKTFLTADQNSVFLDVWKVWEPAKKN